MISVDFLSSIACDYFCNLFPKVSCLCASLKTTEKNMENFPRSPKYDVTAAALTEDSFRVYGVFKKPK